MTLLTRDIRVLQFEQILLLRRSSVSNGRPQVMHGMA
jgi:hypothetical protein